MENASKALILIGGVLIAILLISLGIAFANNMQEQSSIYYKTLSIEEINKINNELTKDIVQIGSEKYITAQGIYTLRNKVDKLKENHIKVNIDGKIVYLKNDGVNDNKDSKFINYYEVTKITYDENSGLITEIKIKE